MWLKRRPAAPLEHRPPEVSPVSFASSALSGFVPNTAPPQAPSHGLEIPLRLLARRSSATGFFAAVALSTLLAVHSMVAYWTRSIPIDGTTWDTFVRSFRIG